MKTESYQYSVLMSVYWKESSKNLYDSMYSIWNQTVRTNDFVLICDGPLTRELDEVIEVMAARFGSVLRVFRQKENKGLGQALRLGVELCKNELIARMDSDDISLPERCEAQLEVFKRDPAISIVSAAVEEFSDDGSKEHSIRRVPETQKEILQFAKSRNPFNHPCVMYRRSSVLAAGNYRDFYFLEDYDLWVRMLLMGQHGFNIQRPLLLMRTGDGMYKRRSGKKYAQSQKKLFRRMYENGFIGWGHYMTQSTIRAAVSMLPNSFRKAVYVMLMR